LREIESGNDLSPHRSLPLGRRRPDHRASRLFLHLAKEESIAADSGKAAAAAAAAAAQDNDKNPGGLSQGRQTDGQGEMPP
jgi:hypothetical protein